ncbi:MAG: outer membrane protein assembly factor BamB family protein [Planctomycetota bacterium]
MMGKHGEALGRGGASDASRHALGSGAAGALLALLLAIIICPACSLPPDSAGSGTPPGSRGAGGDAISPRVPDGPPSDSAKGRTWPGWRGPGRDAISPHVPVKLPSEVRFLWRTKMTGPGLAGVAATARSVIVSDKDAKRTQDIWRCLGADDGKERWQVSYEAKGKMDYSNAPRATPAVYDGLVYLLGAFGHLHCVRLDTGRIVWKKNIIREFGAKLPGWGMCAAPLVVDDKLIVNPGGPKASIVALHRRTGEVIWRCAGAQAAYASFIVAEVAGKRQIIGYDAGSAGGWDLATGERLWTLVPKEEGDFNVPTPVFMDGKLLLATENNGTRLYAFRDDGTIEQKPIASNEDLLPDTQSPVVVGGLVIGNADCLYCLDAANGLSPAWEVDDDMFADHAAIIGGNGRALVFTASGNLALLKVDRTGCGPISRLKPYGDAEVSIWSHPALVPGRLYIRDETHASCLLLE